MTRSAAAVALVRDLGVGGRLIGEEIGDLTEELAYTLSHRSKS